MIELQIGLFRAVRRLREARGWNQVEAARRLEIPPKEYAQIESTNFKPTLDRLIPAFFGLGGTTEALCQLVQATDEAMHR